MKFTDRSLRSLKPKDKRYNAWKDNGLVFGLRVSPKGRKTFIFMYRFQEKNRMMTIGKFPHLSLAKANETHAKALTKLEMDIDLGTEIVALLF